MKTHVFLIVSIALLVGCSAPKEGEQEAANPAATILLKDFAPEVINNIPKTHVERAKFDIIDMHAHDYASSEEEIAQWTKTMDKVGVLNTAIMHCSWIGRPFEEFVEAYTPYKDHFKFWC